jgi:ketosteroid isomerase-like protein
MKNRTILGAVLAVFIISGLLLAGRTTAGKNEGFSGMSDPAQITQAQRSEIEKTLTEAHKAMLVSINQLSTEGWAKYISEDFRERVGGGNVYSQGKEACLKGIANMFSQRASQKLEMDSIEVHVISPESAYVLMIGWGQLILKSGRHGGWASASTTIWRKEPGGWKFVHFHESTW